MLDPTSEDHPSILPPPSPTLNLGEHGGSGRRQRADLRTQTFRGYQSSPRVKVASNTIVQFSRRDIPTPFLLPVACRPSEDSRLCYWVGCFVRGSSRPNTVSVRTVSVYWYSYCKYNLLVRQRPPEATLPDGDRRRPCSRRRLDNTRVCLMVYRIRGHVYDITLSKEDCLDPDGAHVYVHVQS